MSVDIDLSGIGVTLHGGVDVGLDNIQVKGLPQINVGVKELPQINVGVKELPIVKAEAWLKELPRVLVDIAVKEIPKIFTDSKVDAGLDNIRITELPPIH